jgi:PLP dependent protein
MSPVTKNLMKVRGSIADAITRSCRKPEDVTLVVVTKTWPVESIREVYEAGEKILGENRVQELLDKKSQMPPDVEWHLIGPLQKNKVRRILPEVAMIESVDSLDLAERMQRIAEELGLFLRVLLEVNTGGEATKHGFDPQQLESVLNTLHQWPRLKVEGLMAIPPFSPDPEKTRPHFLMLRESRDRLQSLTGRPLPHLSMGMSHDYPIAIEEGATIVRVGSAIFGNRD